MKNENDIPNKDIGHIGSGNMSILKGKKTELGKTFTQKIQKEKKVLFNKTLFSVFLFTTNLKYTTKRNEQTDILADIFWLIDSNSARGWAEEMKEDENQIAKF